MRNLEEKIADWREQMAAGGVKSPTVLDELESHLREEIDIRLACGDSESDAFERGVVWIGTPGAIQAEFNKVERTGRLPMKIGATVWAVLSLGEAVVLSGLMFSGTLHLLVATHIFCLAAGYLASFVTGGLAVYYAYRHWFGNFSTAQRQSVERAVLWFSQAAAGLAVVGFILGVLWSGQNRGTYWGGTPRETGGLCASIWLVGLWSVQRFFRKDAYARMQACIGGNIIVGLAWSGAVVLSGDSLPSHFGDYWLIELFLGLHLVVFAIGLARRLSGLNRQRKEYCV
jgi:hypothetical protein